MGRGKVAGGKGGRRRGSGRAAVFFPVALPATERSPHVTPLPPAGERSPYVTPLPLAEERSPYVTPLPLAGERSPHVTPLPLAGERSPYVTPLPLAGEGAGVRAVEIATGFSGRAGCSLALSRALSHKKRKHLGFVSSRKPGQVRSCSLKFGFGTSGRVCGSRVVFFPTEGCLPGKKPSGRPLFLFYRNCPGRYWKHAPMSLVMDLKRMGRSWKSGPRDSARFRLTPTI